MLYQMRFLAVALAAVLAALAMTMFSQKADQSIKLGPEDAKAAPGSKTLVVAGGCFWCLEPLFEMIKGVSAVEVGYAGGNRAGVTYEQVSMGTTGHAEVNKITYDPKQVGAADLMRIFMTIHDPTTKNAQGPDYGPQYRSAIFYATPEEKALAEQVIKEITAAKIWDRPIVTTIEPLRNYTRAEEYHQNYYRKYQKASPEELSTMNSGYCKVVIEPKVKKFRQKFKNLLRSG